MSLWTGEGIDKDGPIEWTERPEEIGEESRVLGTGRPLEISTSSLH